MGVIWLILRCSQGLTNIWLQGVSGLYLIEVAEIARKENNEVFRNQLNLFYFIQWHHS